MINKSERAQVKSSLNELSNALIVLLKNNPFKDISITDICDKANITRITFYRNCDSKEDLVEYYCENIVKEISNVADWGIDDPKYIITKVFEYMYQNREVLSLLNENNLMLIFDKALASFSTQAVDYVRINSSRNDDDLVQLKYLNSFMVGGLTFVIHTWVKEDFETPIDVLVDICLNNIN